MGDLLCFFGLPRDLRFSNHHRIEGRGHSKEVANRRPSEMDIEVVVFWQLTLAVGQVREIAAKMEEQGVGMDSRFSAKVKLDAVAGPEVDEFGETSKPSELDQVFARRKSAGRAAAASWSTSTVRYEAPTTPIRSKFRASRQDSTTQRGAIQSRRGKTRLVSR